MALVTADFLDAVKNCSWQSSGGGSLKNAAGATVYPHAVASSGHDNDWTLTSAGSNTYEISDVVYNQLISATTAGAHYPGQFVIGSTSYWLSGEYGVAGQWVVVLPDQPPPPPPP